MSVAPALQNEKRSGVSSFSNPKVVQPWRPDLELVSPYVTETLCSRGKDIYPQVRERCHVVWGGETLLWKTCRALPYPAAPQCSCCHQQGPQFVRHGNRS